MTSNNALRETSTMLDTHPAGLAGVDKRGLVMSIEACLACAQACTACADACLDEPNVAELVGCIRMNLDCADTCVTVGRVLSRRSRYNADLTVALLAACVRACADCAEECGKHDAMAHCKVCAAQCRACERACRTLLAVLGPPVA